MNLLRDYKHGVSGFQDLSLLFVRLVLAYGFYEPAMKKLTNFSSIVDWFRDGLHLPFPFLNAVLVTGAETVGVILLVLGFMTRLITLPLMIVMLVAIIMVHGFSEFSTANNGFEIPLYYFIMLFVLMTHGAGRFSLDSKVCED